VVVVLLMKMQKNTTMKRMIIISMILAASTAGMLANENFTQTIRGTVVDDVTGFPLIGANVILLNSDPLVGAAYSPVNLVGEDGEELGLSGTKKNVVNFSDLAVNLFITSCIMMRKELFQRLGGFDTRFRHGEDWDLWLRLTRSGYCIRSAPGSHINYRQHDKSLSHEAMHLDFQLRKEVAKIAWGEDDRCSSALPAFREGLGSAIREVGDTQRAFTTYIACLFLGDQVEAERMYAEVDPDLLRLLDPGVVAEASRYSILRNAALPKSDWYVLINDRKERVVKSATASMGEGLSAFADAYFTSLLA